MDLLTFFGAPAIQRVVASGQLIFHAVGDTGVGTIEQENVAAAMARDINNVNHELGPSFMVHLGDVLYGPNKDANYADRFYRIYDHYDRLIFAVPGNHDGEVFPSTDPATLAAFRTNFCAPTAAQPPMAGQFGLLMPTQPGPYWHLQAPFLDLIGLYSNAAEDLGIINNPVVGTTQKQWLQTRLTAIAQARTAANRKALVIAVHHPPYARGLQQTGTGHPGSPQMLQDIDDCCAAAGILPDAVLAGHTHSAQRYMRTQKLKAATWTIPYLIAGTGGIGVQQIPAPTGVRNATGDVLYASAFKEYGYLTVTASPARLTLVFTAVNAALSQVREQTTIDLATHMPV
ncbi:MAG TPA: metallophosphoesterase [Candidatus Binatia bacterium]|nr:metallophosphoesterase [Candidatus Binatia bacterium]